MKANKSGAPEYIPSKVSTLAGHPGTYPSKLNIQEAPEYIPEHDQTNKA